MTWTTRILAMLNILAAGFLFWYAGNSYRSRLAWTQRVQQLVELRDGAESHDWFKTLSPEQRRAMVESVVVDDRLLAELDANDRKLVESWEAAKRAEEENKKGRGDPVPARPQSEQGQREAMAQSFYKHDPNMSAGDLAAKLLGADQAFKDMVRRFGPEGFTRIVATSVRIHTPRLRSEERNLINRKASLLHIRESHKNDIAKLKGEIERLTERSEAERGLRDRALAENEQRRKEITALYAELEEVVAARDAALGSEADNRAQLAEIQRRITALTAANRTLEDKIRSLESGPATRGGEQ